LVEDNADYQELMRLAFANCGLEHNLVLLSSAREALDYLGGKGRYSGRNLNQQPRLILLDLNLPKKNGFEVLKEIKSHPQLKLIPIVILTSSRAEKDILESYRLYASCYIAKPFDYNEFIDTIRKIEMFWFKLVHLPSLKSI